MGLSACSLDSCSIAAHTGAVGPDSRVVRGRSVTNGGRSVTNGGGRACDAAGAAAGVAPP